MPSRDYAGHEGHAPEGMSIKARAGLVLFGFLIVAGTLLFTEHRAHVLGVLIWLPLLVCPLMHLFVHGGHHHGRHGGNDAGPRSS